jgi:tetratricopeptide (TPR) repeat protein
LSDGQPGLEIPGVSLGEILGRGGMSTIYAGTQAGSEQKVAVKVLNAGVAALPAAHQRFLRGAKLHSQLKHPNIVRVLDYGESEGKSYVVQEYLSGGDLNQQLQKGLHLQAAIKIIKDIARALDYAHAVGVIHRDIKPENILFRKNGSAVLTDFDIAVTLSDENTRTDKGTVFGTPEYISPEQAAGRPVDGRSDLYSLSVVMFRMFTGDLPYRAETAMGVGVKHLQDPIPKLPNYLTAFQQVIDKALAKKPEARFQTGEELVEALDRIRSEADVPEATIKSRPIDTQEIVAVGGDLLSTTRDPARQERQSLRLKRRRRVRSALLVLLLAAIGAGGFYAVEMRLIDPDRLLAQMGIGEDPLLIVAWSEAQSMRQDPNQGLTAIVAAYRRVLSIDPDHAGARSEVANLNADWKASIREAFMQRSLQRAQTRLEEGKSVFPNDPQWVQMDIELQNRQRAERIVSMTEALLTGNGISDLPSATAAIQSYQEVLRLAPAHPEAQQALSEIALHYAGLASAAAESGEVSNAINLLERATAADATLTMLDDVRKLISQATTARAAIDDLLQQARQYRAEGQLIKPSGENAAELYHRVLATDPDNVFAAQGLDEVTAQITASAEQLLAQGDLAAVDMLVAQAAAAGMSESIVNEIRGRMDTELERLSTIEQRLAQAEELIDVGYLTAPTNENAITYLREVQQLDPGNEMAAALLQQCAQRLAEVAREAYEFGLGDAAERYLNLALTITPEVAEWVALRERWEAEKS